MKQLLLISLIFMSFLASAQLKKKVEMSPKTGPLLKEKVNVPPPKKKGPLIGDIKFDKTVRHSMDNVRAGVLYRSNGIVNNMGKTKVTTYLTPVGGITASNKAQPKPRKKGTGEKDGLICTNYTISLSPESESFDAPLADKMSHTYPGAAYDYNNYISNNTQPAHNKTPRNPIILQLSSSSASGKKILVTDPTKDNLVEAAGTLKYSLPDRLPNLTTEIHVQTIVNEATFALNVEAGGGGFGFKAAGGFQLAYDSKKTYMSIDYKQKNYVITASPPDTATNGFYKNAEENGKYSNVFMSSVTYGRRVIGVIETELDQESMGVTADLSYKGFGVSADLGLDVLDKLKRGKTKVRLLFIGGDGTVINVPEPTEASVLAKINAWLSSGTSKQAVPVEYTFKNMNDVGMRWESVASNISYDQCVPKPPPDAIPQPWDIIFTLKMITNNKKEKVMLGVSQSVGVMVNGQWKGENSNKNTPILCWMQDWDGCQPPPHIDFNSAHSLGAVRNYTISHEEFETNPVLRLENKRIVMYATGIGGSKNENNKVERSDWRIQDIGGHKPVEFPVHVNGRIFTFSYLIEVRQRPGR